MDVTKPLLLSVSVRWHRIPGITQPKWSPGLIYISLVTRSSLPLGVAPFMQDCAKLLPHTRPLWRFLPPSQPCPGGPSMHLSLGLPDSLSFVLLQSSPLLSALSYQPEGMLGTTHLTMSLFCSTIYIRSLSFPGGIWLLTGCPENFCMPTSSCLLHLPAPASGHTASICPQNGQWILPKPPGLCTHWSFCWEHSNPLSKASSAFETQVRCPVFWESLPAFFPSGGKTLPAPPSAHCPFTSTHC